MSNAGKAQNILQHEAKPIVKFIVPSPLEPLTTPQKKTKKNSGVVLLSHSQIYSTIAAGDLNSPPKKNKKNSGVVLLDFAQ